MILITVIFLLMYDYKVKGSNFGAVMAPGQQNNFWDDIVFRNKGDVSLPQVLMPDCPQSMRCVMRNFCSDSMQMTHQAENSLSFQSDDRGFLSCVMKHVPMLGVCCRVVEELGSKTNHTIGKPKEPILVDSSLLKEMSGVKPNINPQRIRQRPTPLPAYRYKKPTPSQARIKMARNIVMKRFKAQAQHLKFSNLIEEQAPRATFPITTRRPSIPSLARRKPKQSSMVVINVDPQAFTKPKPKEVRKRPVRPRNNKDSALITRFNQRYPQIQELFLSNLLDLLELQERKNQKGNSASALSQSTTVFVSCPAAMKCVQRDRCDMKGWMTEQPRSQLLKFSTQSVPLIVCDDPNSSLQDTVCCRDTHYKEEESTPDDYEYYEQENDDEEDYKEYDEDYENYDEDYSGEDTKEDLDSDLGVKALLDIVLREEIIEIAALERERRKVEKQLSDSKRVRDEPQLRIRYRY